MAQILGKMNIGDTVSFTVYPSAILGSIYDNCLIKSILDYEDLVALGQDPDARHAMVYGTLPTGSPNNPQAHQWLKVKLFSGEMDYIGIPWINADSIQIQDSVTITVTYTNVSSDDVDRIRIMNSANGFSNFTIAVS